MYTSPSSPVVHYMENQPFLWTCIILLWTYRPPQIRCSLSRPCLWTWNFHLMGWFVQLMGLYPSTYVNLELIVICPFYGFVVIRLGCFVQLVDFVY